MKKFLYTGLMTLAFVSAALNLQAIGFTGTSHPFEFGSPPVPMPLSFLAFMIPVGLIVLVSARRYLRLKRKATL